MRRSAAPAQPKGEAFPTELEQDVDARSVRIRYSGSADSREYNRLLNLLVYFHGTLPVKIEFTADGSVVTLDEVCFIDPNMRVIGLLRRQLGDENVILERPDM